MASSLGGKLNRLSRFLIGFGFFWMLFWAVIGGLLAAKINATMLAAETSWLQSLNRTLLRSAHAHMNAMGLSLVVMGLCVPAALRLCSLKTGERLAALAVVGVVLFGTGLMCEAYFPIQQGIWPALITVIGGFFYMISLSGLSIIFLSGARNGERL